MFDVHIRGICVYKCNTYEACALKLCPVQGGTGTLKHTDNRLVIATS